MDNLQMESTPKRPSLWLGAVLGALTSLPVIALAYLGTLLAGLAFFPFDLFDWLARVLPGNVITLGIDSMVRLIRLLGLGPIDSAAKAFEQATGILLVIAGGAALGLVLAFAIRRADRPGSQFGAILGAALFLLIAAIELNLRGASSSTALLSLLWLAILIVGWARLLGGWLSTRELAAGPSAPAEEYDASRRALLVKLAGGSVAVAVAATGIGRWLELQQQASGAGRPLGNAPTPAAPGAGPSSGAPIAVPTPLPPQGTAGTALRESVPPAPGTRPELTATEDFYRIDINTLTPIINQTSWKLEVGGLFDRPRALTLSDLLAYPAVTQTITQACISNPIGGDLVGTVNYTGLRLRDLLMDLALRPEARGLSIRAADGFYESVGMLDLMDPRTLLVYGMNGETLTAEHGFPLRIYIANRYGMKQPKWITSIEAIDHDGPGYWVDRGWSATAHPQIISVVDAVAKDQIENGRVPVGGIAWAGDRGIRQVEVQVDNGEWQAAVLRTPPLSPLTWVHWRYDWPLVQGTHTFRVRATDGTGALQTPVVQDTYPDGATGYHSLRVTL